MTSVLDVPGFARLLGTSEQDVERTCGDLIRSCDFRYAVLDRAEFEKNLLEVTRTIDGENLPASGEQRRGDWEKGWAGAREEFIKSDYDLNALVPKYIDKYGVKRLYSRYIRPLARRFEEDFYTVYRHYLFKTWAGHYGDVYEFGCGTGYNLVIMARLFPEKRLFGLDWSEQSVKLVNAISAVHKLNLSGRRFDYFRPDYGLGVPENSVFITLNSLEQLGGDFQPFLDFVLAKRPALVINSEPFIEMYDESDLLDRLAARYHRKRNYLNGYLSALKALAEDGKIKILKMQRVSFGSVFHEGYSIAVWKVV